MNRRQLLQLTSASAALLFPCLKALGAPVSRPSGWLQDFDFSTDEGLTQAIEDLFDVRHDESKKAYEEYVTYSWPLRETSGKFRVYANTYALATEKEGNLPLVRWSLYHSVRVMMEGKDGSPRYMYWRKRPESFSDREFDSNLDCHRCWFRLGAWTGKEMMA